MSMLSTLRISFLAVLAAAFIRLLRMTWRVRIVTQASLPQNRPVVFCFWHGDQAALFAYHQKKPIVVMSSLSADGTLQANILTRLGYVVCRGSSSRGGAAGLKAMVSKLRAGCDAAFAVDGPTGPYHLAKPGAIKAAGQCDAVIVPVSSTADSAWVFTKSWDRYTLPRPFSRVTIRLGAPMSPALLDVSLLSKLINIPIDN